MVMSYCKDSNVQNPMSELIGYSDTWYQSKGVTLDMVTLTQSQGWLWAMSHADPSLRNDFPDCLECQ